MSRALFLLGVLVFLGGALLSGPTPSLPARQTSTRDSGRQLAAHSQILLGFEPNVGQSDAQVKFLFRGRRYTMFLAPSAAVWVLNGATKPAALRMCFVGGNPATRLTGLDQLAGKSNYFVGNDTAKWRTNVPHYARVRYQAVYPGIDLVFYQGPLGHLEYDFVITPGADPGAITLTFEGSRKLELDARGDLILHLPSAGPVPPASNFTTRLLKPLIYQPLGDRRQEISGGYVLTDANQVRFEVASYDHTRPLVIDPALAYSTYLGGSGDDGMDGFAIDAAGNAYITGYAISADFPTTAGAFDLTLANIDAFVSKLNPTGSALVYSTYLGGSAGEGTEHGMAITVDAGGNAYVTGDTSSTNFPTTPGAFRTIAGLGGFVTKLNATGSALVYSTYFAGGRGIFVDSAGNAYIAGNADAGFPTTLGSFQPSLGGCGSFSCDGFVAKLNSSGSALVFSTFLGGSGDDFVFEGIGVDADGNVYVVGRTNSTNFPTVNPFQAAFAGGGHDAFVTKLNPSASAAVYSTYLGGSGNDEGRGIAVDAAGNAYVTGQTSSTDFPKLNAVQSNLGGGDDAFAAKFNPTGAALLYSTYLGGNAFDRGSPVAVDQTGSAYIVGFTHSTNFPTANALQPTHGGGAGAPGFGDAFVTKLSANGSSLVYSTYLGGSASDGAFGVAVDSSGNAYVAGDTSSTDFPIVTGAMDTTLGGIQDPFVVKITAADSRKRLQVISE